MLLYMAKNSDRPVQIKEISEAEGITPKYLEQIALLLKKAVLIKSIRGPKGGYILSRPAGEIKIGDIVRALESVDALVRCVKEPGLCKRSGICEVRDVWVMATSALFEKLDSITLGSLINSPKGQFGEEKICTQKK